MKYLLAITLLLNTFLIYSQNGPGGVGSSTDNELWLIAENNCYTDAGITEGINNSDIQQWNDISDIPHHAVQTTNNRKPVLKTNNANSYATLHFENGDRILSTLSTPTTGELTFFVVARFDEFIESNSGVIQGSYSAFSNTNKTVGMWVHNSGKIWGRGIQSNGSTKNLPNITVLSTGQFHTLTQDYGGSTITQFINGTEAGFIGYNNTLRDWSKFGIGSQGSESMNGDIAEVIVFKEHLNATKQIIINNYLSAKYNTALTSNDFYTQDNSGNGDFDHNVAGIGQETATDNHIDSQGTGVIRINTPSALSDGDYLFWGEETKNPTYDFSSSTEYTERLNSKWRVSKQNDLGTISLSVKGADIDLSGMESCAGVKLIVSNSSDFTTKTTYSMVLSGGTYTASNVNFSDGDYFTFEYFDTIVVDGTKFYNGSGASNVPSTTDQCYKLLVKSTADGTLALTENAHVREIEVENGGKLVVNTGLELKVNNGIILDGDIRLIGNSQLIQTHTGTSQVTGNGKLYLDKQSNLSNVYQSGYWSSPVTTSGNTFTIEDAMKDGTTPTSATSIPSNLNFTTGYDGNASTKTISSYWLANLTNALDWNRHRSQTASHNVTQGYNMKSLGLNFTFVGKPNDGDYTSTVTSGNSSLLGNPYPSAMNADAFLATNNTLFSTLYFWDGSVDNSNTHVRSAYTGGYATYNGTIGVGFNGGIAPNNRISVGQGFFVDATDNGTIIFNNSHRLYDTSANLYARPTQIPVLRIGLDFSINETETFHRQLAVTFINGTTNGYEPAYDAIMYDMQPSDFALKVDNQTNDFVITGIEDYNDTIEIPLHVKLDQQRNMAFSIDAIEGLTPDNIYLKDTYNNQYYNLNDTVNIYLEEGNFTDRFFIVFRNQVANINDVINNNNVTIIDRTNSIKLKSNLIIKQIQIFNTIGQVIFNKKLNNNQTEIFPSIYKGQFVIIKTKLENGQEITTKLIKK